MLQKFIEIGQSCKINKFNLFLKFHEFLKNHAKLSSCQIAWQYCKTVLAPILYKIQYISRRKEGEDREEIISMFFLGFSIMLTFTLQKELPK